MRSLWPLLGAMLCASACYHHTPQEPPLAAIQIQDRNGIVETISTPERISHYEGIDFLSAQPYKKVLRTYKKDGKNHAKITTYHPNGTIAQYLETEEMRAHGAYREWFENGQLKIDATVVGGTADIAPNAQQDWLFDGVSYVWDDQGRSVAELHYEKGFLNGSSTYFYPSGALQKELYFSKNELDGDAKEFFEDGLLRSITQYKEGIKEGLSEIYFIDGKIAVEEMYSAGRLHSGKYYNPKGELVSEIENGGGFRALFDNHLSIVTEFRMGNPEGAVKHYSTDGHLLRSYFVKNGQKQGEELEFFLSSELTSAASAPVPKLSVNWHGNMVHGRVKTWYKSGKLQSEREYVRNQKQGAALAWYEDGNLMLVEEYEGDRLIQGRYYKINAKEPVSTITNGNGLASLYDETGALLQKITYIKGKPLDLEE